MKNEVSKDTIPDSISIKPLKHRVKYHEIEKNGNVHHSNFIKWMEDARMDMLDQVGLGYKQLEILDVESPVVSLSIEYRGDIKFGDTILVDTKIIAYDGNTMEIAYRIYDFETGDERAVAKSKHCFINNLGKHISLKRKYPELETRFFS